MHTVATCAVHVPPSPGDSASAVFDAATTAALCVYGLLFVSLTPLVSVPMAVVLFSTPLICGAHA